MLDSSIYKKLEAYLNAEGDKDIESIRISSRDDYIILRSIKSIGFLDKVTKMNVSDIYKMIKEHMEATDKNIVDFTISTDNLEIRLKEIKDIGVVYKEDKADIIFYL